MEDLEIVGGSCRFPMRTPKTATLGGGFKATPRVTRKAATPSVSESFVSSTTHSHAHARGPPGSSGDRKTAGTGGCGHSKAQWGQTKESTMGYWQHGGRTSSTSRGGSNGHNVRETDAEWLQRELAQMNSSEPPPTRPERGDHPGPSAHVPPAASLSNHMIQLASSHDVWLEELEHKMLEERREKEEKRRRSELLRKEEAEKEKIKGPEKGWKEGGVNNIMGTPTISSNNNRSLLKTAPSDGHMKTPIEGCEKDDDLILPSTPRVKIDKFLLNTIEDLFIEQSTKSELALRDRMPKMHVPVSTIVSMLETSLGASLRETVRLCPKRGTVTLQNALADIQAHPAPYIG